MDEQQALGAPYRLTWRGRELKLGPLTLNVMAQFTALCKSAAIVENEQNLKIEFGNNPSQEQAARRAAQEKEFRDDMRSGLYGWGGAQSDKWRTRTIHGEKAFLKILLEEGGTPLSDRDLAAFRYEKIAATGPIMVALVWDSELPNEPRPADMANALTLAGVTQSTSIAAS